MTSDLDKVGGFRNNLSQKLNEMKNEKLEENEKVVDIIDPENVANSDNANTDPVENSEIVNE